MVGSVAVDWVITPKAERETSVGGSATFFSMAASYFGPVRLVGIVGKDFPEQSITDLQASHVDTEGLEVVPDGLTFRWKGRYHDNMNERDTLDTQLNVFEHFDPKLPESYRRSEYLFLDIRDDGVGLPRRPDPTRRRSGWSRRYWPAMPHRHPARC